MHREARILFVHANAEWYGSDRSFVLLATGLTSAGWAVTAVVPAEGRVATELRRRGVKVVIEDPGVPRPRAWSRRRSVAWLARDLPRSWWRMWRLARRADIVHVNTSTIVGAVLAAAAARRPVVLHLREHQSASSSSWRGYVRLIRPFVHTVIAISHDVADESRRAGFGSRVVVVHNGLRFRPRPSSHQPGVLSVGRINEWKGHEILVDAVAALRARGMDVPVAIAGDAFEGGEHHVDALRDRISHRGVDDLVTLLGYVEDVDRLHSEASVFVSAATRPEPFGLALIEAMAAGLVPIATDAGGPRDIVRNGETGLLVPMGDAESLAAAMERLWRDPEGAAVMADAAAADVRSRFSIDRTVAAVAVLYTDALWPSHPPGRKCRQ